MPSNNFLVVFYIDIFLSVKIYSQICTETNMTWREVPETYTYTYMEAYEKTNCLFWCTDSRVATAVGTRIVRKQVPEKINVCCQGYKEEKSYSNNSFYCTPVCSKDCVNGFCKSPDVCTCNPGYIPDTLDPHKCIAMCIKGCEHGSCTAPNTCDCDFGYKLVDGLCIPVCQEACDNGICIAPDVCQCYPGYKKSNHGICEPFCSDYTDIGECVVTLTCEPGWEKDLEGSFETCRPVCLKPCNNGKCITPDNCECLQGYKKSRSGTCEPFCSNGCPQGICISPEICVCESGWYQKESNGLCLPHCDIPCGNGTCIAPNICECLPGYVYVSNLLEDQGRNNLCVPTCKKCEGSCISPEDCTCDWPWKSVSVSLDGNRCNCLDNCSQIEQKCEKTVCLLFDVQEYVTNGTSEGIMDLISNSTVPKDIADNSEDSYSFEVLAKKGFWYNFKWLYAIGFLFLIVIIVIIAVIIKKKFIKSLNSKGLRSNGDDSSAVVQYKQSSFI